MLQSILRAGLVVGFLGPSLAWAQSADEVLEPGDQALPPVEGTAAADAPSPPGTPNPDQPPDSPGPSGTAGTGPANETNGLIALLTSDQAVAGPVLLELAGDGETVQVTLNDDGQPPDVQAGDGIWAGLAESAPLTAAVTVKLPGAAHDGGTVSWSPDQKPRELKVRILGDTIEARATAHTSGTSTPPATVGAPATPAAGTPTPVPDTQPAATERPAATPSPVAQPASSGMDWLGGLALVLALAALGVALLRRPTAAEPEAVQSVPEPVVSLPPPLPPRAREAGVLGSGTPALSGGVSVWTGPDAVLGALLGTLASGGPVVVASAKERTLPPTWGGPVFVAASLRPDVVVDAVQAVQANGALSVCVLALPGADVDDSLVDALEQALPDGVGAVVFGPSSSSKKTEVALGPAPGGVSVVVGGRPLRRVRVGPRGFVLD